MESGDWRSSWSCFLHPISPHHTQNANIHFLVFRVTMGFLSTKSLASHTTAFLLGMVWASTQCSVLISNVTIPTVKSALADMPEEQPCVPPKEDVAAKSLPGPPVTITRVSSSTKQDFAVAYKESLNFFDDITSKSWAMLKEKVKQMPPNSRRDVRTDKNPATWFQHN